MSRALVQRLALGAWALLLAAGIAGVVLRLVTGHELAGYGSYIPWGLWVALYAWFVGLSAGAFLLFAIGEVFSVERLRRSGRPALVVAVGSLISGLVLIGLDLGHLGRFWHVYVYGNPRSLMSWEIAFYTAFGAFLLVTFMLVFRNDLAGLAQRPGVAGRIARGLGLRRLAGRAPEESGWLRGLALAGGVFAVAVAGATGALFGVVGARPLWHTGLLPLLFIVAAVLSAAAVLAVLAASQRGPDGDRRDLAFLGRLTLALVGIALLIEWADVSIAFYSQNLAAWDAYEVILTGPYWWVFWLVHLLAGVAIPAVLLLRRPRSAGWVALGAGLVAVTLVAVRLNVVVPGLAVPQIEGLDRAFQEEGLTLSYFPALVEWLVALFAGALFLGVLGAWHLLVPIRFFARPEPVAAPTQGEPATTRVDFLGKAGLAGGALVAAQAPLALHYLNDPGDAGAAPMGSFPYQLAKAENLIYSVCQQCNTQCGIAVKIQDGVVVKTDGSPYSPWTLHPPLAYDTPLAQAAAIEGGICPKGQAGLQSAYDPYRIRQVLKRAGPRGSGKWQTVLFEQAVSEIVEGGDHFGEGPVPGLRELWALRDTDLSKEMAADVDALWHGDITVEDFKAKHADNLDVLIDPDHPDLGPKNNQVVYAWGRLKGGRSELYKRFFADSFGTTNGHGHTTVCQGSLYFSGKAMSEQFIEGKFQGGSKFYWQADVAGSEFVIFVGASPFEANYGPPYRTAGITDGLASGRLKIAVVDPRLSKTAAKAWKWLPIQPGTEGALALAMTRWVIEEGRYDEAFLANANKAAAAAARETTWTNATWLIKIEDGEPTTFLRASEIGLAEIETRYTDDEEPEPYEFDYFVAMSSGLQPLLVDPNDEENPVVGTPLAEGAFSGIQVKTGLQVLFDSAREHTLEEWAEICGLDPDDIVALAREFTSHGKKAAADIHRGVSQHTNGYSNVIAWFSLNALIGNYDWMGGMSKATTYDIVGDKDGEPIAGKPFVLKDFHPAKLKPFGISSIRHGVAYEKTTIFEDYPAKRPWYYLASDVYQEIVPSIGDAYPYPIKALFLYMGTPVYSLPGGHTNIEILSDPARLPLFVASDIVVGETSMYADYIFPDLSYLERWEFAGSHPSVTYKVQPIRQPVIAPLTETVTVFGAEQPLSFEAMLLGLAEKLELPGFGPDGLGEGRSFTRPEDLYLLMAANVAAGDKEDPVAEASEEELELFVEARAHLPNTVFDPERWAATVGPDWWSRVVYVLGRGGRFASAGYDGEKLKNPYGKLLDLYQEKTAKTVNAMTGQHYPGVARYIPAPQSSVGEPIDDGPDYPLRMITFREVMHTKSRTPGNYWLQALLPENSVILNKATARELGLEQGDWVRVVSASNPEGAWPLGNGKRKPMVGKVRTIEGLRPGVVAFSLGHGHWAYGAEDVEIDGHVIPADARRAKGIHANAAMRIDPVLANTTLSDLAGGSAVFYDTQVRLEPASAGDVGVFAV